MKNIGSLTCSIFSRESSKCILRFGTTSIQKKSIDSGPVLAQIFAIMNSSRRNISIILSERKTVRRQEDSSKGYYIVSKKWKTHLGRTFRRETEGGFVLERKSGRRNYSSSFSIFIRTVASFERTGSFVCCSMIRRAFISDVSRYL